MKLAVLSAWEVAEEHWVAVEVSGYLGGFVLLRRGDDLFIVKESKRVYPKRCPPGRCVLAMRVWPRESTLRQLAIGDWVEPL